VAQLREIVMNCVPDAKEKLAYNVPYYYRPSRICFIWPGSVRWGGIKSGVLLGFCKGHLLRVSSPLERGSRTDVYTKTFYTGNEINQAKLSQLLFESVAIDEEEKKMKLLCKKRF
jgi:hypothetical protein